MCFLRKSVKHSVRDRKQIRIRKFQSFSELGEAWLRLFRNTEHIWSSREEEILKNELKKKSKTRTKQEKKAPTNQNQKKNWSG